MSGRQIPRHTFGPLGMAPDRIRRRFHMTAELLPGVLDYDDAHCEALTLAILQPIVATSTTDGIIVLHAHEIRDALSRALAELVALEPAPKTRRLIEDAAHFARRLIPHHRRNPKLQQATARMTRFDLGSGG
jgi:hypothetical protein